MNFLKKKSESQNENYDFLKECILPALIFSCMDLASSPPNKQTQKLQDVPTKSSIKAKF